MFEHPPVDFEASVCCSEFSLFSYASYASAFGLIAFWLLPFCLSESLDATFYCLKFEDARRMHSSAESAFG